MDGMELHVLPFGAPAWVRRKDILKDIIDGRPGPPHDFRSVLYLVANERTVYSLRVLFLDALEEATGARGCIPPAFGTFSRLMESRAALASARPVIDTLTRGLVIEELARAAAGKNSAVTVNADTLAPSIAPLIASALDKSYIYGVPDGALERLTGGSLTATLLRDVKRAYESWLDRHGLADSAAAKAGYTPSPAGFTEYETVVLDGFYDADPAEMKLMQALSAAHDFRFVIEAPGLTSGTMTGPGMPHAGTDALIDALGFGQDGKTTGDVQRDKEAALYSGAVFGGMPLLQAEAEARSLTTDVKVVGATSPAEEVWYIARDIKAAYIAGECTSLDRVMVYLPELDPYLPELEQAFTGMGIPFHVSAGRPLSQSPVAAALMDLLALPLDNFSFISMRKVFSSPLTKLHEAGNHPEAFGRFARAWSITGGRDRWQKLAAAATGKSSDAALVKGPMDGLMNLMKQLPTGRARLMDWTRATQAMLDAAGITASVDAMSVDRPELAGALDGVNKVIGSLGEAAARLHSKVGISEFRYILARSLADAKFKHGGTVLRGVRVLGGLELLSEPFDVIYAGGLTEGSLPANFRPDIFFPRTVSDALGLPGQDAARTREARRFLGIVTGAAKVRLCHPQAGARGPQSPSPYIRALEPFVSAGAVEKIEGVTRPIEPWVAMSPGELMRATALSASLHGKWDRDGLLGSLADIPDGTPGLSRARALLSTDGKHLPPSPPEKTEFSVTELEEYLLCGYRYYQGRVLKSAPVEDPDDDLAPHAAGSVVHDILSRFYAPPATPVTTANREESLARLRDIAGDAFHKIPDTLENRELARRFVEYIAPRFIDAEAGLENAGYMVCWPEKTISIEVDDDVAGHFVLKGKVDRIEVSEGGEFAVVDYKTGAYPGSGGSIPLKDQFQLPLYAYMIKMGAGGGDPETKPVRPSSFVYYGLKTGKMRDVVVYDTGLADDALIKKFPKRKATQEGIEDRMEDALEKAKSAVRGILAGSFEPTCDKPGVCKRCVYIALCERGQTLTADDEARDTEESSDED